MLMVVKVHRAAVAASSSSAHAGSVIVLECDDFVQCQQDAVEAVDEDGADDVLI